MTLRVRIALTMALLTALTAAAVAAAGYRVTAGRLDAEINSSIDAVARPVLSNATEVRRTCSGPTFVEDPKDRPGTPDADDLTPGRVSIRKTPRDLLVQCLDRTGTPTAYSPSKEIPISSEDRAIAEGTSPKSSRSAYVTIDGETSRVVTVRARSNSSALSSFGAVQIARSLGERDRVLSSLLRRVLLLALAAVSAAALAGLWLARRIAQPLVVLTGAAERIAESGDLNVPLAASTSGRSETGRLSHAFTTMVDSLRESREQQARLVQDAGHELRTPLTSLRTNIALLRRPDLPDSKRQGILADLSSELLELTTITNELVALSANTAEDDQPTPIDLGDLLKHSVARWRRRSTRSIALTASVDESSVVLLPKNGAQRLVDNLLSNAVKFSPEGAAIDVALASSDESVTVTVRDRGKGVAPNDLPHVFDRFYRSNEARPLHGSGLGLSIVHDVVTRHGGSVAVANHPEGGALFTVTLPLLLSP